MFSVSCQTLQGDGSVLDSLSAVAEVVEQLNEASQWFPGGSKEMRVSTRSVLPCAQPCYMSFVVFCVGRAATLQDTGVES